MIEWVYRRARRAPSLDRLVVATDSAEIFSYCQQRGMEVIMTSGKPTSGTARLAEVMTHEPAEIYVNIQGDEPMVSARHIELLLDPFRDEQGALGELSLGPIVTTLKVRVGVDAALDPNHVKVVTGTGGRALYFSRSPIPFFRDPSAPSQYYKHLGLYAYSRAALRRFGELLRSPLEDAEGLEQLRLLEDGVPIFVLEAQEHTTAVDTEADLKSVETHFRQAGLSRPED